MLARQKGNETMTRYYHDKISLMKKCGLGGENAMSCLIRGLPDELRANAKACGYRTPEELYYGFLSSLEITGQRGPKKPDDPPTRCRANRLGNGVLRPETLLRKCATTVGDRGTKRGIAELHPPRAARSASARDTLPTPAGMRLGGAHGIRRRLHKEINRYCQKGFWCHCDS